MHIRLHAIRVGGYSVGMDLLAQALTEVEFLAVDCETNGRGGSDCELTEVGAVLVGGGELHDCFSSLVAVACPLTRGVQRLTGITPEMLVSAPPASTVLDQLVGRLRGRVMVAHSASFDRRVLAEACRRAGVGWPDPPVLCTLTMARRLLPLQREGRLAAVASALGIELDGVHRALADARTCARVLCALLPRLRTHAATVGDAQVLLRPRRPRRSAARGTPKSSFAQPPTLGGLPDFESLPRDPGVYIFRDGQGAPLYVGKSISIASRARAHFAPSASPASWTAHAKVVDYQATGSELGALVLENRLIKRLRPPGNRHLVARRIPGVYVRCRLDAPYPALEVGPDPVAGHAVNIGPLRNRRHALELVEQLDSMFALRHCGRRLARRAYPSAYGQMGRCLSPCLGDLDPNLYRRRLDAALELFVAGDDARQALLERLELGMRAAAREQRYERAEALRLRKDRLCRVLARLDGLLRATHARPMLIAVAHPRGGAGDLFWIVGGRVRDWASSRGPEPEKPPTTAELERRTRAALGGASPSSRVGTHVPPAAIDEVRIVAGWLASHPETAVLDLDAALHPPALERFLTGRPPGGPASSADGARPCAPAGRASGAGHRRRADAKAG